jgi:hypothetical protein
MVRSARATLAVEMSQVMFAAMAVMVKRSPTSASSMAALR